MNTAEKFKLEADKYNRNLFEEVKSDWERFYETAFYLAQKGKYECYYISRNDRVNRFGEYVKSQGFNIEEGKLVTDVTKELKISWGE